MNIQKVLVAGCGTMGSQIAMQAAPYGYSVQVYDLSQQAREKAEQYAHSWFNRQVSKGRMTWEEAQAAVARLTFTGDLAQAAAGADLVIEAVPDVAKIKRAVLSQIDQYVPEHALYGSNSSYLVSLPIRCAIPIGWPTFTSSTPCWSWSWWKWCRALTPVRRPWSS